MKKNHKLIIAAIAVILISVFAYRIIQAKFAPQTKPQEKERSVSLIQVGDYQKDGAYVYTTGKLEALDQLDIKAELSANVKKVNFKIGDKVAKGQVILELDNSTLAAQLSQAQAALAQRKAGASTEDIQVYQSAVDTAKANLDKTKSDNQQMISSYEIALQAAKNNLNLGGENLVNAISSAQPVLANSLLGIDNILGVDNKAANDSFENDLSVMNTQELSIAKDAYNKAKLAKQNYDTVVNPLNNNSSSAEVNVAADKAKTAISAMKSALYDTQQVLEATVPTRNLPQATLSTMKANINALSSALDQVNAGLTTAQQGTGQSGDSLNSYNIAYNKAKQDLENAKTTAANILKIQEAAYNQALATLNKVKASPRAVDLASLQAMVAQSASVYDKSIIRAPFDGVISSLPFKQGEFVGGGQIVASIVNKDGLQVRAYINQKESPLVSVGSKALIEDKYNGLVTNISPSIDTVTKKIEIIIALTDKDTQGLTVGQYVNAKIAINNNLDKQKFIIPLSAVKVYPDKKTVFSVDENGILQEKEIQANGILGDNIEVDSGLSSQDKIVQSVAGLNAGEKVSVK